MKRTLKITLATAAALAAGMGSALAHTGLPGHVHGGFAAGLLHPLGGLDHLLAMIAVGVWSALTTRGASSRVWIAPVVFVTAMLAGAVLGHAGAPLPLVETGIALSVALLGLMILARVELPTLAGAGLVGLFAIYHGHAHGAEATGAIAAYMAGFAVATASLHVCGILAGTALLRSRSITAIAGALIAGAGTYLLAA